MEESKQTVFMTGVSSGLGLGLAKAFLQDQSEIYGVSRRTPSNLTEDSNFHFASLDLADFDRVPLVFSDLLAGVNDIDLAILNAGILGKIKDLKDTSLKELRSIMDVNLWANKVILDWFKANNISTKQVITLSSGAAVNGNRGWSGYSISKAALNMLTKLYARENPETHFTALAPGLIDTAMQDYLYDEVDENQFPSITKLKAARNTSRMPRPDEAAHKIIEIIPKLLEHESGSFIDIRHLT